MEPDGPRQIGPYQILEELGRGGMGVVYRAFDPTIGRPLAIKLLRMPHMASEAEVTQARHRFTREAAAAGRLSHPGIVTLYQLGQEPDFQYLAMELVPGGSLEKLMRGGQPWPVPDAVRIIRQVAEALDYAHANGIVHRDIKPANVLVQPDGRAKVTDFGIARIATQTMTRTGMTLGTPAYMPPEQIQGAKVDAKADQFSLGVVAYELLAGKLPFDAPTDFALAYQIVNAEPAALVTANPMLPSAADGVIRRALAKSQEGRFANCVEFAAVLEVALKLPPMRIETLREVPSPRQESPRKPRTLISVWVGVGLVAAGIIAGIVTYFVRVANPLVVPPNSIVNENDGLRYVYIPPGTFTMGCSPGDSECGPDEKPPHAEQIANGSWLGQTEVTQAAWTKVKGGNPSQFKGDQLPVDRVDWNEASDYCKAIGGRLPTEKEWEYAARAGTTGARYGALNAVAWYDGNSGEKTHRVGLKQANAWGLYDMLGNVWEWTADNYYASSRVLRGGSWEDGTGFVRSSNRLGNEPSFWYSIVGVRCVGESR